MKQFQIFSPDNTELGLEILTSTWYFLEGYYDKGRGKIGIRVNGEWTNETDWPNPGAHAGNNDLRIGTPAGVGDFLNGTLDEVGIWKSLPGLQNTATSGDFLSLDSTIAEGPRNADGSLPVSDFLHLAPGSQFIDAGVDVGLPFNGTAPDLGAFETDYS